MATVPDIVPDELLPSANSLTSLSGQIVRIAGPALGAAFVALGGTPAAFVLNAASFGVSALCLLPLLHRAGRQAVHHASGSMARDIREGLDTVLG